MANVIKWPMCRDSFKCFYSHMIPYLDLEDENLGAMDKTGKAILAIREICGELCDTTKAITPGAFIGTVTSKVGGQAPCLGSKHIY